MYRVRSKIRTGQTDIQANVTMELFYRIADFKSTIHGEENARAEHGYWKDQRNGLKTKLSVNSRP